MKGHLLISNSPTFVTLNSVQSIMRRRNTQLVGRLPEWVAPYVVVMDSYRRMVWEICRREKGKPAVLSCPTPVTKEFADMRTWISLYSSVSLDHICSRSSFHTTSFVSGRGI